MSKIPNRKRLIQTLPHIWDVNDLLECIKSHGDKTVYKYFEGGKVKEMTYAEFYEMIHKVAAAFDKLGLVGKVVADYVTFAEKGFHIHKGYAERFCFLQKGSQILRRAPKVEYRPVLKESLS